MTKQKAKTIYKLIKFAVIFLFSFFFVLIVTQTIIINTKTRSINNLQSNLSTIQNSTNNVNNQIEDISNNYSEYAEEELRKEGYFKDNEQVFQ